MKEEKNNNNNFLVSNTVLEISNIEDNFDINSIIKKNKTRLKQNVVDNLYNNINKLCVKQAFYVNLPVIDDKEKIKSLRIATYARIKSCIKKLKKVYLNNNIEIDFKVACIFNELNEPTKFVICRTL